MTEKRVQRSSTVASRNTIAVLTSDHQWMTLAAAEALPDFDREVLGAELELLVRYYCEFPDHNWTCYGEWGGWSGYPDEPRLPDIRRAWHISQYEGYDPVTREGVPADHGLSGTLACVPRHFPSAAAALHEGRCGDALRYLGCLVHRIQDCATFPRMQAIHRRLPQITSESSNSCQGDWSDLVALRIEGYEPRLLGQSLVSAVDEIQRVVKALVVSTEALSSDIRRGLRDGDLLACRAAAFRCYAAASQLCADLVHTLVTLAIPVQAPPLPASGSNLVSNPSFEEVDGGGVPLGWYVHWHDLHNHAASADVEGDVARNHRVAHSGRRSVKLMWTPTETVEWRQTWPCAIPVESGEHLCCSAWVKTQIATGRTHLAARFFARDSEEITCISSTDVQGTTDWTLLKLQAVAPPEACFLLLACCSDANEGAAWFDDVSCVKLDDCDDCQTVNRATTAGSQLVRTPHHATDHLLLRLQFDGDSVRDASPFRLLNGPILLCSGTTPADLRVRNDALGPVLSLDGLDDFLEVPRSRIQDPLCPSEGVNLYLRVRAHDYRDCTLVAKGAPPFDALAGYRLDLTENGFLQWRSWRGGREVVVTHAYSIHEWLEVWCITSPTRAAVRVGETEMCVPCDGRDLTPSQGDFYVGAEMGICRYFKGEIAILELWHPRR